MFDERRGTAMKRLWTRLSALVLTLTGAAVPASAAAAADDLLDRLRRVPGRTVVEGAQPPPAGFRFFRLTFTQPADHRHPDRGTFEQRLLRTAPVGAAVDAATLAGWNPAFGLRLDGGAIAPTM